MSTLFYKFFQGNLNFLHFLVFHLPSNRGMVRQLGHFSVFFRRYFSKFQYRADLIPPLGLDDAVLFGDDTGRTKGVEDRLQREHGGIIFLGKMAEGKLLAPLLHQFQELCCALVVGEVAAGGLDAGA